MIHDVTQYKTIKQLIQGGKYPIKLGQLRRWVFDRDKNGLSPAVMKLGKTILINEEVFTKWIQKRMREATK